MDCTCGFRPELWTSRTDRQRTLNDGPALVRCALDGASPETRAVLEPVLAPALALPTDGDALEDCHTLMHALDAAGRLRHAGRSGGPGTVQQLSLGGGGVPKTAVDRVRIDGRGLVGDVQRNRRHHGRPWQAVCLWSAEVVEGLQAEGHPIGFGSAGENVTVRGLDWATLSAGLRLQVGTAVLQLSAYAIPCAQNRGWFTDGDVSRMAQEVRPGASRLYAGVVTPGEVSVGDAVLVEP